jgi:hypothetical protein
VRGRLPCPVLFRITARGIRRRQRVAGVRVHLNWDLNPLAIVLDGVDCAVALKLWPSLLAAKANRGERKKVKKKGKGKGKGKETASEEGHKTTGK